MTTSRFAFLPVCALAAAALLLPAAAVRADENLFGFVRGAETLPKGHFDVYQFLTLRTGKAAGTYNAFDFDTEVEYGVTDKLQVGVSVVNHFFHLRGVDELNDADSYKLGGFEASAKYRILSPFKDVVGLALRLETGYLPHDDVGGLKQEEFFLAPEIIVQKNYLDDTLILQANAGIQLAWGKKPAEEYDYELALNAGAGASYRFAPNWFIGLESHVRSEYPKFDFGMHEHTVIFAGPSLHYGAKNWWATLSWGHQMYGNEVDPTVSGKAYAEEALNEFRLKVGFNF